VERFLRIPIRCLEISSKEQARSEMERIGVDPVGIQLMVSKQFHQNLKISGLTPAQANIIKQDILSVGGEAAVSKGVVSCEVEKSDAILSATEKQFTQLIEKLMRQPHGLPEVAGVLRDALNNIKLKQLPLKGRTRSWTLGTHTLVMGILNVTPDSFSDGGKYFEKDAAAHRAREMVEEGAHIIDVGGESSRPGAKPVGANEELGRVLPVVGALAKQGITVSVDTTKAIVAEEALKAGAEIINDISSLGEDPRMAEVVAEYNAAVVLMHMRGTPETMQEDLHYEDMMAEIFLFLKERLDRALASGIEPERIIIDPGIGFGKSPEGNLEIIRRLAELKTLGRPVLVGTSRKSFIGKLLGAGVEDRLPGTLATTVAGILAGAHMVRVHDVKQALQAARTADALKKGEFSPDTWRQPLYGDYREHT
jgi:dihydropteroate synthase